MPVLMAIAVVLTANHYVVDGIAGASLALVGLAVAVWYERAGARFAVRQLSRLHLPQPRPATDDHTPAPKALAR
jgi:membrane-associated phospholipid phosphatase